MPRGVARRSCGGVGRARVRPSPLPLIGLACGDGGIERPRRGVRAPPWERAPGIGGRRRGAGEDMLECGVDDVPLAKGCIYILVSGLATAVICAEIPNHPLD